jgi:hypothetical protein
VYTIPGSRPIVVHTMNALRFETPMGNNLCRLQWVKLPFEANVYYRKAEPSVMGSVGAFWGSVEPHGGLSRIPPPCRHSNKATRYALPTAMTTA